MHLYIAYASENAAVAEQIYLALLGDGHEVFFDRPALQAGDDFDGRFREAIATSDVLVFLISPASIRDGCYALTELAMRDSNGRTPAPMFSRSLYSELTWTRYRRIYVPSPSWNRTATLLRRWRTSCDAGGGPVRA